MCEGVLLLLLLLCVALISCDLGQADAMARLKAQFAARREAIVAQFEADEATVTQL